MTDTSRIEYEGSESDQCKARMDIRDHISAIGIGEYEGCLFLQQGTDLVVASPALWRQMLPDIAAAIERIERGE